MNYDKLLEGIVNCSPLMNAVHDIVKRTGAMNLVTLNWREVLEESPVFKNHLKKEVKYSKTKECNNVFVKNIYNMDNQFNIVVPGFWILDTSTSQPTSLVKTKTTVISDSLKCCKSEPLEYIGAAMALSKTENLADNCRFYIKSCDPAGCKVCGDSKKKTKKSHKNTWCVKFTKIYDGEKIKHTFRSTIVRTFRQGQFMGILHVTIRRYLMYGDNNFKIGGDCNDMILFNDLFSDNIENLDIEYPPDSNDLEEIQEDEMDPVEGIPCKAKETN